MREVWRNRVLEAEFIFDNRKNKFNLTVLGIKRYIYIANLILITAV